MADAGFFHVSATGEEIGPSSAEELAEAVLRGSLTEDTLCRPAAGPVRFQVFKIHRPLRMAL